MKNSSNKFRGKKNKEYKKNADFGYHSKNTNHSEKDDRFLNNSTKNKKLDNFKKNDENNTFSSLKRRNPRFKSNTEFPNKKPDNHQEFTSKKNFDDWIWGKHSVYESLSSERALIGFGVLRKSFLQTNSIFCLRSLNQKESSLKKFLGIGFRN